MRFVFFLFGLFMFPAIVAAQTLQQFKQDQEAAFTRAVKFLEASRFNIPFSKDSSAISFAPWLDNDQLHFLTTLNAEAAAIVSANRLLDTNSGLVLSGDGIQCGIWEDGFVADHLEFDNRILSKEGTSAKFHATHVTGTLLAKGLLPAAKGLAPAAQGYTYFFDNDLAEMAALQETNTAKVSNHSYGTTTGWSRINGTWFWFGDATISTTEDYKHGFYSNRTKAIDALANLVPDYTIVWPAGNDRGEPGDGTRPADCNQGTGFDCIITEAVAKNVITVGAVNKFITYTSPLSVPISNFSSFGPTDDGRIKPDVVAPGVNILSTSAAGNNLYLNSSGTSMAAPVVTGSIVLLQELHQKLTGKNFARSSTVKALLIHTAKEAGQQPGPDYGFGWGLIDTEAAATFLLQKENEGKKLIERNLLSGEEHTLTLQPAANSKISVTLCWTDPEGNPVTPIIDPTQRMLVHDLDIRLIDDQGTVHFPWILNPTIPQAQATRGDNIRDNVEKIEVESAFKRTYTLSVRHKGNLNFGGQTYSLLISYIPALPAGKTLYRIGAGNWNDPARWSFTSGGAPANLVPGENDCAIIDNRSLQNNETLIATTNLNIKQCIIVSSKNATFNLNNNILSFSKNLTIAAPNWSITNGKLLANGGGLVTIAQGNLATSELIFENGNWECSGNLSANKVIVKTPLTLTNNFDWDLTTFETTSTSAITFGRSKISATIVNVQGTHQAADLILSAKHNATFSFNTIYFDGEVFIPNSNTCSITNASGLEKVFANGTLEIITNTFVKKLTVGKSASIKLSNQITLQVEEDFIVDNNAAISITSVGKANLKINTELMACLENATIANVDLLGNAAISLTGNATLTGATGWQTVGCADILQAKFSVEALCKTAWGRAVNLSIGNPESYLWTADFDAEFSSNEATPVINLPSTNNVTITLRVSKDTRSHQVSKTFTLTPNTLPENEILLADGRLISMQQAPVYTWLMNNEVLPQATERFLPISDFENKQFEVVIADGNCTRISKPFVITGIDFLTHNTLPYPNPTKGFFTITKTNEIINKQDWFLTNTEGRQFTFEITNTNTINVSHLPNGVYFFQNKRKKQTYRIVIMGH